MARRRLQSGPRRLTTWVGPADQGYVSVGAGAKVLIASYAPNVDSLINPTIVRTRGDVSIDVGTAATIQVVGAYGLCIVDSTQFAAGAASVPGPWSDSGWDGWFVWRSINGAIRSATGVGMVRASWEQNVDSKAMRKITDDEVIVLVAESQAVAFSISMPLRMLLKLA